MALTVVTLPVPAGNGVGAAVDVHTLDSQKSFALDGTLGVGEQLVVEVTEDPAGAIGFTGLVYWDAGNVRNVTIPVVAAFARIRRFVPGGPPTSAPTSSVSATTSGTNTFFQLAVPASGVGAAVDVSAGGQHTSFSIHDGGTGLQNGEALVVEGSNDNVSFVGIIGFTFKAPPNFLALSYKFLRIRRLAPTGASMSFFLGTSTDSGAGGGGIIAVAAGAGISVATVAGTATVTNTGVTSAIAGTGISVNAATGAVTFTNTGVTSIIAGAGISVNAATGAVTVTNIAAGGGTVTSVNAGTGITISGPATDPIVTSKLSVGVAGGQTAFGGTLTTQNLTLQPNAADAITGRVIVTGIGLSLPTGSPAAPSINFGTNGTGVLGAATAVRIAIAGAYSLESGTGYAQVFGSGATAGVGYYIGDNTGGLFVDGANGIYLAVNNFATKRMNVLSTGAFQFLNSPFMSFSSGAALAQANGTVMRHGVTPPNVATATGIVAAYNWDAVTVTFTGGGAVGGVASAPSFIQIKQPTYTSGAAPDWSGSAIATVYIAGAPLIGAGTGAGAANLYGLFIDDANGTGTGSLRVANAIFACTYQNNIGFDVFHNITAGRSWNLVSGVAVDTTGGTVRFQMNTAGTIGIGDTIAGKPGIQVLAQAGGNWSDPMIGRPTPGNADTHGFPIISSTAGAPSALPAAIASFGGGAALVYDKTHQRLNLHDGTGLGWVGIPVATAIAAGAGVALINTAPAGIVSLNAKWETFIDIGNNTCYRPYFI